MATADGELIEVEAGRVTGGANTSVAWAGFTGTGFVENLLDEGSGVDDLYVERDRSETVLMNIRYSMGASGPYLDSDRTISVYVNGNKQKQISFQSTDNWVTWSVIQTEVDIDEGTNKITFRVDGDDTGWVNLDSFAVFSETTWLDGSSVIQAEAGALYGPAQVSQAHDGYTGDGFVENIIDGAGVTGLVVYRDAAGVEGI